MAPQIVFLMKKETYDSKWLKQAIELLKEHGVIKKYKEVADKTSFQNTNVNSFKSGSVTPSKPFIDKFLKVYGNDLKELASKPKPEIKEAPAIQFNFPSKKKAADTSALEMENAHLKEKVALLEELLEMYRRAK